MLQKPSLFTILLLSVSSAALAADKLDPKVEPGSRIYIEAADGFDTYLSAALEKKKVPVTIVADKSAADFELDGVSDHQKPGWAKTVFLGQIHSDDGASIKLINLKTGEIVFAYAVDKKNTLHGRQTAAEACAKHLKEVVH